MDKKVYGKIDIDMSNIVAAAIQMREDVNALAMANMRKDIEIGKLRGRLEELDGKPHEPQHPY